MPTTHITQAQLGEDNRVLALAALCGLCSSKGEARKLITAGGLYLGDEKVTDVDARVDAERLMGDGLMMRKGKKSYHCLVLEE